jgi:undecaprenyl-phosphate 4-deoxy-4-formamido-L-arabinose transferase
MASSNTISSVSVVAPVFNEETALPEFIRRTIAALESLSLSSELVLVDDGSRDQSPQIIARAAREHPGIVRGVIFNRNYGQHMAVLCGLAEARGDLVITLDTDLQNPPEEIPNLVKKATEGFDVVGTVRMNRRDTAFRKVSSRMINRLTARVTGVKMTDYGCMLRAYRRPVVDAIVACPEHNTFIPVLANSFAHRTAEIGVSHAERAAGASKYGLLQLINLQFDLLTSMTTFPLRLLSLLGAALSILGIAFGGLLLVMRFVAGPEWAAQGVFTLFAVLFFFIGAQFLALGLLGEYIGRIYKTAQARPRYFIRETVGSSALAEENQ